MADPAAPVSNDAVVYRPLSGFAVAGFLTSSVFALLLIVTTVVALFQGLPFFFPLWLVALLAGAGVVLSLLGQQQVRNSEGTRAGMALARAGVWISLFPGLGYFAYYYVTGLALTSQANAFLLVNDGPGSGFFPRLEKSDDPVELRSAYLLTLPATSRGGAKPEDAATMAQVHDQPTRDGAAGRVTSFQRSLLVRVFGHGAQQVGKVTVEALGVQSWGFESNSYKVARNYRLRSPEVELEVLLPVQSTEGEAAGQMRQWFVAYNMMQLEPAKRKPTPLGEGIKALRAQAAGALTPLLMRFNKGQPCPEFRPEDTDWDRVAPAAEQRTRFRRLIEDLFAGRARTRTGLYLPSHDGIGEWELTGAGKLLMRHRIPLHLILGEEAPGAMADLLFDTVSRQPIPAEELSTPPVVDWDIASIRVERLAVVEPGGGPEEPGARGKRR